MSVKATLRKWNPARLPRWWWSEFSTAYQRSHEDMVTAREQYRLLEAGQRHEVVTARTRHAQRKRSNGRSR